MTTSGQIYETHLLKLLDTTAIKIKHHPHTEKTAVIVDPRFTPLMEAVIYNFMFYMNPHGWNLLIYSAKEYQQQVKTKFPTAQFIPIPQKYIHYPEPSTPNMTITAYNNLFLDPEFWHSLPTKHITIFQTDCIMFKMFDPYFETIYAYSGANYYNPAHISFYYGGINGGFSIRNRDIMLECLKKITWDKINDYRVAKIQELQELHPHTHPQYKEEHAILNSMNEDIFFTHACEMLLKPVPDYFHRMFLAVETDPNENTAVYHGWNKNYHTTAMAYNMLEKSTLFHPLLQK